MTAPLQLFGRRLMEFNQLPSQTLHPSRREAFARSANLAVLEANPKARAALHRHWSRQILQGLGVASEPVFDTGRRELVVALLPPDALENLARQTGAVLCGPRLRRTIVGAEVRTLRAALGDDIVAFVRQAESLHPGLEGTRNWTLEEALSAVEELGQRTLLAAVTDAGPAVARRFELKLPTVAAGSAPLAAGAALELECRIIEKMDPTWLSSFPKDR
ncbi:SctK family type III secretion system sorting platform protein [Achromobacter marplatensis]|uniref:SctK family type III secretion system sorting platform protein n=1 Tax=Achromobacter marplatensis TaxID=470868 RepID=UPI0039F7238E